MHRLTFEDGMRRRSRDIVVYDFRRTFAHWMEGAGIPRTRRKLYLGHAADDVTDLYERHEVTRFLAEDRRGMGDYLVISHEISHDLVVVKA